MIIIRRCSLFIIQLFLLITLFTSIVSSNGLIQLEYFYSIGCPDCTETSTIISEIKMLYNDSILVNKFEVGETDNYSRWEDYGFKEVPAIVINNLIKIPYGYITKDSILQIIDIYLLGELPIDSDLDALVDIIDLDDDNDGLEDNVEQLLGTNTTDNSDVLVIQNNSKIFTFLDIDNNGLIETYYDSKYAISTNLTRYKNNLWLVDTNNDGINDYILDLESNTINPFEDNSTDQKSLIIIFITILVVLITVILSFYLIKRKK